MKNIITGIVAIAAVAGLGLGYASYNKPVEKVPAVQGVQGPKGDKGDKGDRGPMGLQGPAGRDVAPRVGSVTNPDLASPYFSFGNVRRWAAGVALTQGASTTCQIQSPAATSTLTAAAVRFTVASSSAELVEIGKSTNGFATTTLIGTAYRIDAGAQATIVASTSPAAGDAIVFSPNTYFVVKMGGGLGNIPTGFCRAMFEEI